MVRKSLRGVDPKLDYTYGNNEPGVMTKNSRPFYRFFKGMLGITPGAMIYGNETQWLAWRPLIGPAIGVATQFRTIYNVQPISQQTGLAATTGLGGVVHGQVALQPLSDPYNG
jgi:hypothetical protein